MSLRALAARRFCTANLGSAFTSSTLCSLIVDYVSTAFQERTEPKLQQPFNTLSYPRLALRQPVEQRTLPHACEETKFEAAAFG